MHGSNSYRNRKHIAITTAINPHEATRAFLKKVCKLSDFDIKQHFTTNLYYQAIMRTALRMRNNTDDVHVYCIDGQVAMWLDTEYFENATFKYIPDTETIMPVKKTKTTAGDRVKFGRMKKKYPFICDMDIRDVMVTDLWHYCNTSGKLRDGASEGCDGDLVRLLSIHESPF
jgi:hypothetical protein